MKTSNQYDTLVDLMELYIGMFFMTVIHLIGNAEIMSEANKKKENHLIKTNH